MFVRGEEGKDRGKGIVSMGEGDFRREANS